MCPNQLPNRLSQTECSEGCYVRRCGRQVPPVEPRRCSNHDSCLCKAAGGQAVSPPGFSWGSRCRACYNASKQAVDAAKKAAAAAAAAAQPERAQPSGQQAQRQAQQQAQRHAQRQRGAAAAHGAEPASPQRKRDKVGGLWGCASDVAV